MSIWATPVVSHLLEAWRKCFFKTKWTANQKNFQKHEAFSSCSPQEHIRVFIVFHFHISMQVYSPGPYGEYVTPPPHAPQIIYTADGQPYPGAYQYQYQGKNVLTYSMGIVGKKPITSVCFQVDTSLRESTTLWSKSASGKTVEM